MDSTRLDDHAEISIIENPERVIKQKSPEKPVVHNTPRLKLQHKTPRSISKPSSSTKMREVEPSPSVITKKKLSPKSNKKKTSTVVEDESSMVTPRSKRNACRKPIIDSDDETHNKENEYGSEDTGDTSYSDSELLTEDESDNDYKIPKLKSVCGRNAVATKRSSKKSDKNDLIFLDLSAEEVVRVDKNFHANVPEDDLANITRKFLETDLNNDEE